MRKLPTVYNNSDCNIDEKTSSVEFVFLFDVNPIFVSQIADKREIVFNLSFGREVDCDSV